MKEAIEEGVREEVVWARAQDVAVNKKAKKFGDIRYNPINEVAKRLEQKMKVSEAINK